MNRRYFKFCGGTYLVSRSVGFSFVGTSRHAPLENLLIFQTVIHKHTVSQAISNHQFRFLIGLYSVAEIWFKKIENGKNNFLDEEQNDSKKIYVNIKQHSSLWIYPAYPWCKMRQSLVIRRKYRWWEIVSGTYSKACPHTLVL